jgi:hypothetical protein
MTNAPGTIRDAVYRALEAGKSTVGDIRRDVEKQFGKSIPRSSVQSSLNLQKTIERIGRGRYALKKKK